ncbi:MAG TPA: septal ring lytic transglycosylase RlpA family protein [Longimicrobiales bacterium]|nr:septal ring lytic transglycosylase RlpA family protein [Longimicrobiales bacterium]
MRHRIILTLVFAAGVATSCAGAAMTPAPEVPPSRPAAVTLTPVVVDAQGRMTPAPDRPPAEPAPLEEAEGEATYYASKFDGRPAASGVVFRNSEPYAAHRSYPFGTVVRVTNLVNDRSVIVRVIDRGPHGTSARAKRTIIDVSQSAARELDFIRAGRIPVRVEVLEWGTGIR